MSLSLLIQTDNRQPASVVRFIPMAGAPPGKKEGLPRGSCRFVKPQQTRFLLFRGNHEYSRAGQTDGGLPVRRGEKRRRCRHGQHRNV